MFFDKDDFLCRLDSYTDCHKSVKQLALCFTPCNRRKKKESMPLCIVYVIKKEWGDFYSFIHLLFKQFGKRRCKL